MNPRPTGPKPVALPNCATPRYKILWQGQKDSNPRHVVLETTALPTELYPYVWRRGWDSNPRPLSESLVFKTSSLNHSDTSPCPILAKIAAVFLLVTHRRFELTNAGIKTQCLTAWRYPKKNGEPTGIRTPDTRLRRPLLYPTEL